MPLTSNTSQRKERFTKIGPTGNVIISADYLAEESVFNVSPNPCINPSDFVAPSPYSFVKSYEMFPNGEKKEWYKAQYYEGTWKVGTFYDTSSGPQPGASWYNYELAVPRDDSYNRGLAKLYDQIKDSEIGVNTSVGEGRESLEMLQSVAKSAAELLRDLRGSKKRIRQALKELGTNPANVVGGMWLGWSVGWKPLLSDIENLRRHVLSEKLEEVHFDVKSRASWAFEERIVDGVSNYYWPGDRGKYESLEYSVRHQFGVRYKISNLHTYENWRSGLVVRPTLIWELTWLSFVADYFYNIGQLLELLEASLLNNGIQFVHGYHTVGTRTSRTFAIRWTTDRAATFDTTGHSASYNARREVNTKTRTTLSALPTPVMPILKLPSASGPLFNIAALLTTLISRK